MKFLLATTNQIQFEDEDPKSKSRTAHVYGSKFGYPTFRWSILNILNILNIKLQEHLGYEILPKGWLGDTMDGELFAELK